MMADDRHRILFANSRFLEMIGISREDLSRFDPSLYFSSQELNFLRQQIDVAFRAGHNRYAFVVPRKGGGRVPVVISSRTLQNSAGGLAS
jgi:PAS domain S-box-containing protein